MGDNVSRDLIICGYRAGIWSTGHGQELVERADGMERPVMDRIVSQCSSGEQLQMVLNM